MQRSLTRFPASQQRLYILQFLHKLSCHKPCWHQARLSSLVNKHVAHTQKCFKKAYTINYSFLLKTSIIKKNSSPSTAPLSPSIAPLSPGGWRRVPWRPDRSAAGGAHCRARRQGGRALCAQRHHGQPHLCTGTLQGNMGLWSGTYIIYTIYYILYILYYILYTLDWLAGSGRTTNINNRSWS